MQTKMNRRNFVECLAITCLSASQSVRAQSAPSATTPPSISKEEWMNAWLGAPGSVGKALYLGRFVDPTYFTLQEISWTPSGKQKKIADAIVVPGFVTDLASIPRIFWSSLRPDGNYAYAAIIHDYLYWFQPLEREDADLVLKYAMEDLNVGSATVATIYAAVRAGGSSAWNDNKTRRQGGERRILAKYPDDPKMTWDKWKTTPGVFK